MADGEIDDIAGDIRASMAELSGGEISAPAPVVATPPEPIAETPAPRPDGRDEKGRFAPKTSEIAAAPTIDKPQQSAEAAPVTPPRHWKPEAKAEFLQASPTLQKQMLEAQEALDKEAGEFQPKAQRLQEIDSLLAPHKERWALSGVSDVQGMSQLLAISESMERDPVNTIVWLMRTSGVTPAHLGIQGGPPQQQGQPTQQGDPRVSQLMQQVQSLTGHLTQQQQRAQQAAEAEVSSTIEAFAKDPANTYFENVKEDMAMLINAGKADDLPTAYDMAIWARPDIRKLVSAQQARDEAAKTAAAQQARTANARHAGASVTGSPGLGAAVPKQGASGPDNIADDVRASLRQLRGSV